MSTLPRLVRGGKMVGLPPFTIGKFTFTPTGVDITGKPDLPEYEGAWDFATRAHQYSGFWLADLLRYGESRKDWAERLQQVHDHTGLSTKTLMNVRAVGAIDKSRRREGHGVEFHHHVEVAGLEPHEQVQFLEKVQVEGWNRRELRQHIRASKRVRVIEGQAILAGMYRVIYADPPWKYSDSGPTEDGSLAKAVGNHPPMTMADIMKLPVAAHSLPDSILFMWTTASHLFQNPGPRDVMEAWGFKYKTNIVWNKVLGMPGHYGFQVCHEHLIIATRGSCLPMVPTPHEDSIQVIRREGEHSSKPEEIRRIIEKHWTHGPYLELFGRQKAEGWDVFGNDARLWT